MPNPSGNDVREEGATPTTYAEHSSDEG